MNIDSAISAIRNTNANSTSFVNSMNNSLKTVLSPSYLATEGKDKMLAELGKLDNLYRIVYTQAPGNKQLERSFALDAMER